MLSLTSDALILEFKTTTAMIKCFSTICHSEFWQNVTQMSIATSLTTVGYFQIGAVLLAPKHDAFSMANFAIKPTSKIEIEKSFFTLNCTIKSQYFRNISIVTIQ